jgi:transposase
MRRYINTGNREQISVFPMSLDMMISEDNVVRAIDAIVDDMDITSMDFKYSETAATGRKPYSPVDMFKLYTYSYFNGIRSSRKIEKECHRNIELMWLINELKPDFKTIADFRKDNKKQIKLAFQRFSIMCGELGLISKEMVAVDGSKFKASNSRSKYHSKAKLEQMIRYYTETAGKYVELLDRNDEQENGDQALTIDRSEIQEKLKKAKERLADLEKMSKRVDEEGSIYETDPDARLMRSNNGGGDINYNVQIAVEEKSHLVVATDANNLPTDHRQLHGISLKAKEALQVDELTSIADKGFYCGEEFEKCKEDNIVTIVSKPKRSNAPLENYDKNNFTYDKDRDVYICPMGHELSKYKTRRVNNIDGNIRYVNKKACMACPVKDLCSPNKYGRTVARRQIDEIYDEVDERTKQNMLVLKKRKGLVEHPFGTIKRSLGFTYFLTRGIESVQAENCMHFLIYNIKRVINIMGTDKLIKELRA